MHPASMSPYIHYIHYGIVVGYFFIAFGFLKALKKVTHNKSAKVSLISMLVIFIFCGCTRVFLDLGLTHWAAELMHVILFIFTWLYVLTGQAPILVAGFNDAVDQQIKKEV